MLNRRRTLQTGLATLLSAAGAPRAFAQGKPRVKIRYNEVVHSMLYAPAYVAIAKGYFDARGHVLITASLASFGHGPGLSAYCASKAGVEAFADSLRSEVSHQGVTVGNEEDMPCLVAMQKDIDQRHDSARFAGACCHDK